MTSEQYLQATNFARYRDALSILQNVVHLDGDPGRPLYVQAFKSLDELIDQEYARLGLDTDTKDEDEK